MNPKTHKTLCIDNDYMEIEHVGTLRVYMETDTCDTIWRMLTGCMPSLLSVALFDYQNRVGVEFYSQ